MSRRAARRRLGPLRHRHLDLQRLVAALRTLGLEVVIQPRRVAVPKPSPSQEGEGHA